MKGSRARSRRLVFTVASSAGGLLVSTASAHVIVSPERLPAATPTLVGVVAQEERPGHATTRVTLEAPKDVVVRAVSVKRGTLAARGTGVVWARGRAATTGQDPTFVIAVTPGTRAGRLDLSAVQTYDDGAVRHWTVELSVAPPSGATAPRQHLGRGLVIGAVGFLLVAASIAALHFLRRRELQDS